MKYFDKWQRLICIGAGVSLVLTVVFYIALIMTAKPTTNDAGLITGYEFNYTLQIFYSAFFFVQLAFIAWFIARSITYGMRKKEALKEQGEY